MYGNLKLSLLLFQELSAEELWSKKSTLTLEWIVPHGSSEKHAEESGDGDLWQYDFKREQIICNSYNTVR